MSLGIEVKTLQENKQSNFITMNGELTTFDSNKYDYALLYFIYDFNSDMSNPKYTDIDHTTQLTEFSYTVELKNSDEVYYKAMCAGLQSSTDLELAKTMIKNKTSSVSGNFEIVFYE